MRMQMLLIIKDSRIEIVIGTYVMTWQNVKDCAEQEQSSPEWKGIDNKNGRITLASACALCLNLLSRVWLCISRGLNCCQEFRRGVVYRLIGVRINVKEVNDFIDVNL